MFTPLFPSAYSHFATGKPTGVALSHCITWFQTQPILSLRVRSATTVICGIIVALDSSRSLMPRGHLEYCEVSGLRQLILV